jgi:isoleucyl-tRNA synthetase
MAENYSKKEEEILKFWQDNKIFEKTLEQNSPKGDFIFYDGPPFATGTPHYGHVVASLIKDVVPKFWTMRGYHVERKWGWDCHGLPVENLMEKELGLKNRQDILEYGVDKFNDACETSVLRYADVWKKFIPRMGRFVDMDRDYRTMDLNYMESIWWVFKTLWDKGLIYEGKKSMHICPRCETTLSNFEVTQGYADLKDISATVKFKLKAGQKIGNSIVEDNTYILAWTTTPWTLPGNVALAVGEEIYYLKVKTRDLKTGQTEYLIFAKDRADHLIASLFALDNEKKYNANSKFQDDDYEYEVVDQFKGKQLLSLEYEPIFDYYANDNPELLKMRGDGNWNNAYKIYPADFVLTEEGTGVVHIAPAFGEDDMILGKENNLPFVQHVGYNGKFKPEVRDFAGLSVKPKGEPSKTDREVIKWLEEKGNLFKSEELLHSYPLCWRCDTPLLNYATSSWFVKVEDIKKQMIKNNEKITWVPEHIKHGRFGKWLEGAKDWAISRSRFWGDPLPVWRCECGEIKVIGSIKELEELGGVKVVNPHKHIVDKINLKCPKCGKDMHRVPEVLDCWFESGSMPYAQLHYPFENKEKFEKNFPAQFIAEGIDQTRGWFYTLMVLSTALFNKPAFKHCIVNGTVLAADGAKMSKRLKNYPEPDLIIEKYGADSMRYYLMTAPVVKGEDFRFQEKEVDEVYKKFILIMLNVLSFYKMYESDTNNANTFEYHANKVKNVLDRWIIFKLHLLIEEVESGMEAYDLVRASRPIQDFITNFSTWYLRRSRERFKSDDQADKDQAKRTMKYVLLELAKAIAPFTPFIAEIIYRDVGGEKESVHLESWPKANKKLIDQTLLVEMELARKIVELGLAARAEAGIKVRQALSKFKIENLRFKIEGLDELIKDELNVKEVEFVKKNKIKEEAGSHIKKEGNYTVALDTTITPELRQEGLVREIVRQINALRKEESLTIKDEVKIIYETDDKELNEAILKFKDSLAKNVLASAIERGEGEKELKIEDKIIKVKLIK